MTNHYSVNPIWHTVMTKHINVETTLIVNGHQRCFSADIWLKMKVEPRYIYQRWQNNVETTLKELCRFNVDDPMLFQRWYLVEKERLFTGVEQTTLKQLSQYLLYWCSPESASITKQDYVFEYNSFISFT